MQAAQNNPSHWHWPLTIMLASALVGLFLFSVPLARTDTGDVREFRQSEFLGIDLPAPPDPHDVRWKPLALPDLWSRRGMIGSGGWYRLHLPLDRPPETLQGLYLFRLNMNAALYLNGLFLGDGGNMGTPLARNWNRPLYFTVPRPLWHTGDNELLIHLRTQPGFGMLAPPQLGADEVLRPRYEWRLFLQNELSQSYTILLIAVALFALGLWLKRRGDTLYLWFAGSSLCWAVFNTHLFLRYPPIPEDAFRWLAHTALDFWMVLLVGFVHRFVDRPHRRLESLLALTQGLLAAGHGLLPVLIGYRFTSASHSITLVVAVYLAVLAWRRWLKGGGREAVILALALSSLLLAGLHDWAMENPFPGLFSHRFLEALWRHQFHFLFFLVPAIILVLAWRLTGRFIRALDESERLNRELEARVAAAHLELSRSFEQRRSLELEQASANERERIYRDLHDDIGAKLLSLAIGAESPRHADTARAALQDLRDVVSRSSRGPQPLAFLLADWRNEMAGRLAAAGLTLEWRQPDDLPDPEISPSAALHLGRVLREAVSNVLRHAGASRVEVVVAESDGHIAIHVEDDGDGPPAPDQTQGRGMRNMRARIEQLQGAIAWEMGALGGCRLCLAMPLDVLAV
jgi:signal transduction histidine kinase